MRKQLLLLLVLLPLSASAQTFQLSVPASFNLSDLLDRLNRDGGILPNIGQTYGPLTLNHLGEFRCPQCGSALSEAEQQNAARFASNLIFGKNRVVNINDLGYVNLTPYIEGAKGLDIRLEDGTLIEMRVDKAAKSRLRQIAGKDGAVLTFRIVYDNNTTETIELNVKFDEDQIFFELQEDENDKDSNANQPQHSGSAGGGGLAHGFALPNNFQIPTWRFSGFRKNWVPNITTESLRPCLTIPGQDGGCD
jgi:hypothetical protein